MDGLGQDEELIGQESAVIGEECRSGFFIFFHIHNLKLLLLPHSRSSASIRSLTSSFRISNLRFSASPPRSFATFVPWR